MGGESIGFSRVGPWTPELGGEENLYSEAGFPA